MIDLVFATNNQHKVLEIRKVIGTRFHIITLEEAGIHIDIPEPFDTLEANAREKSRVIHEMTGLSCFSEDTGLEVTALNGEPGVRSARYAGDAKDPDRNITRLLEALQGKPDRSARFRTVISLILNGEETFFQGICTGRIIEERRGDMGFGYDPVFVPDGSSLTFAEMDLDGKNRFSHRKKAVQQMVDMLIQAHG